MYNLRDINGARTVIYFITQFCTTTIKCYGFGDTSAIYMILMIMLSHIEAWKNYQHFADSIFKWILVNGKK